MLVNVAWVEEALPSHRCTIAMRAHKDRKPNEQVIETRNLLSVWYVCALRGSSVVGVGLSCVAR